MSIQTPPETSPVVNHLDGKYAKRIVKLAVLKKRNDQEKGRVKSYFAINLAPVAHTEQM
jgi:hypothetical protein